MEDGRKCSGRNGRERSGVVNKCPVCGGLQVGKVGSDQYFCWNCYLEFNYNRGKLNLYEVAEDGTLTAVEESSQIL